MSKARGRTLADRRFRFTSEDRWGYFFIFVAMVVFVTFTLYPVVSAVRTSFLKYKPFGSEFIGLKNYIDTIKSALFYKAVKNTIVYTAVVVPLSLLIAFSIAIMILPFKKKTQSLFKSVYYLPGIASGVALSVVWLWLYDSSPDGLFNQVLMFFGIPSQNWLSSSKTSMLSLMLMAILSGQGSNIIIYIAALLGIDNSYFEAAELDGANVLPEGALHRVPPCEADDALSACDGYHRLVPGVPERLYDDRRRPGQQHNDDRPSHLQERL